MLSDRELGLVVTAFEQAVGRPATEAECAHFASKNMRRGSSVFCIIDGEPDRRVALSIQGTEYKSAGKYTATGGGLHDGNEDARTAAVRELGEEVVDDKGEAILHLDPADLVPTFTNLDISMLLPDALNPEFDIVMAENFYAILDSMNAGRLLSHERRLKTDEVYAQAVYAHTKQEVGGMDIMTLDDAMEPTAFNRLHHAHERQGLKIAVQTLRHG